MPPSFFKKRLSPIKPGDPIDYKDTDLLKKFITERGKLLPRRMTGLTAKQQRDLTNSVKRARIVALLPFVKPEGGVRNPRSSPVIWLVFVMTASTPAWLSSKPCRMAGLRCVMPLQRANNHALLPSRMLS